MLLVSRKLYWGFQLETQQRTLRVENGVVQKNRFTVYWRRPLVLGGTLGLYFIHLALGVKLSLTHWVPDTED